MSLEYLETRELLSSEIEENNQDLVRSNPVTSELYRQCDRPARSGVLLKERDDRTDGENDYFDANENDRTP